ncbi:MAG: phosphomannomutase/phosphoglucomutase [Firmicutes bacterium]|nr:phosphomannomutase/phosphoglucomutase [Bacillota bacterium]
MRLINLKSGSDIRGTAIAGCGEEVNLDVFAVQKIGRAFVKWLAEKTDVKSLSIAVGHDSRLTGVEFKNSLTQVFADAGAIVFDCGLSSTPSMYFMTKYTDTNCDGSIMITASHHPSHKNGLKFFTKSGGLVGSDIVEILNIAESEESASFKLEGKIQGEIIKNNYTLTHYAPMLVNLVESKIGEKAPLKNLKIVVDAGNGAGGFFANSVLAPLGADVAGSQFLEPDGNFPNHIPNPEDAVAMSFMKRCVIENNADLGIIFDTDVDRVGFVAKDGTEINRDSLIALVSALVMLEQKDGHIVTDSVTSDGLRDFITEIGGVHFRYKRGYQNVIGKAKELNAGGKYAPVAAETSGHIAFLENGFLDDGAYLACRILVALAELTKTKKPITDLISKLKKPVSEFEVRIKFKNAEGFSEYASDVIKNLTEYTKANLELEPSTYEGVRANVKSADGWFLLRPSVHDPNMILNIQSNQEYGTKQIAKLVYDYLIKFDNLILDKLEAFVNTK